MLEIGLSTLIVIVPVVIVIVIGYIIRRYGWVTEEGLDSMSKLVYYIGLPALIVDEVSRTDISSFIELKGPMVLAIVSLLMGLIGYVSAYVRDELPIRRGVWAMSSLRGNMAFIGIPLILSALGDKGMYYASLLLAIGAPSYNILSVIFLIYAKQAASGKEVLKVKEVLLYIVKGILTNSLTLGAVIGVLLSFIRPDSLPALDLTLGILKQIPLPIALIVIGGQLDITSSFRLIRDTIIPTIYKLVLSPFLGAILLILLKAGNDDFVATMIFLASPTAILSYVIASEMDADKELTLNIILTTTALSAFIYIVMLFLLGLFDIWSYKKLL